MHRYRSAVLWVGLGALLLGLNASGCRSPAALGDVAPSLDSSAEFMGTDEDYEAGALCLSGAASPLNNAYSPALGGEESVDVVVTVSSDLRCPYCAMFGGMIEEMWSRRADLRARVRLYFHHFPIESLHSDSPDLHLLAAAVARQSDEAFWDFHDQLFKWKSDGVYYDVDDARAYLAMVGVDMEQLDIDLADEQNMAFVKWDLNQNVDIGVKGTPWILVCGQYLSQWNQLEYVLDDLL